MKYQIIPGKVLQSFQPSQARSNPLQEDLHRTGPTKGSTTPVACGSRSMANIHSSCEAIKRFLEISLAILHLKPECFLGQLGQGNEVETRAGKDASQMDAAKETLQYLHISTLFKFLLAQERKILHMFIFARHLWSYR